LSRFFSVWDTKRSAQQIKKIMDSFAAEHETIRKQIIAWEAKGDKRSMKAAADAREGIASHLRGRFDSAREAVLKAVLAELHNEVKAVGFAIEARPAGSVSFTVNLGKPHIPPTAGVAKPLKPPRDVVLALNIDHAKTDFVDAMDEWIRTGRADKLHPVLAASNMRIATAMENQVLFNQLKSDVTRKSWLVQPPPTKAADLAKVDKYLATIPARFAKTDAEINKILDEVERLLGRKLRKSQPGVSGPEEVLTEEGTLLRDYILMARGTGPF
jgi:hypothetical protein